MYDLLDALDAVITTAEPSQREALAKTVDGYCRDFPDEFFWAVGARSPTFLSRLVNTIDAASHRSNGEKSANSHPSVSVHEPLLFIFG
jgi:hypothetical protein